MLRYKFHIAFANNVIRASLVSKTNDDEKLSIASHGYKDRTHISRAISILDRVNGRIAIDLTYTSHTDFIWHKTSALGYHFSLNTTN